MARSNWFARWVRALERGPVRIRKGRKGRFRAPHVEPLEDRVVLSVGPPKIEADAHPEYNYVMLNAGWVDTTRQPTRVANAGLMAASGEVSAFRLVQFSGPVQAAWYEALVATGVDVVAYVPSNAYLVYGNSAVIARMENWVERSAFVQWEGVYENRYKLDPRLNPSAEVQTELAALPVAVSIQMYQDPAANKATMAAIDAWRVGDVIDDNTALGYRNIVVQLPLHAINNVLPARPDVVSIQPDVAPRMMDEVQSLIVAGQLTGSGPTAGGDYLAYLAAQGFTQAQFDASGFAVVIVDDGVDNGTTSANHFALRREGSLVQASRLVFNRGEGTATNAYGADGHGNLNAHIVGGYVPSGTVDGTNFDAFPHSDANGFKYGLGVAPFVNLGGAKIFNPGYTNPDFEDMESRNYAAGARISSNSWGASVAGAYNSNSQRYDALVRDAQPTGSAVPLAGNQEMVIVFAAGNDGSGASTVGSPGTGKNVITVGASENVRAFGGADASGVDDSGANSANDIISFSSRGPTSDGRFKPEIVAPGTHVTGGVWQENPTMTSTGDAAPLYNGSGVSGGVSSNYFPSSGQQYYTASSGTSHSTPAVAGGAALIRQRFINAGLQPPSPALTKAALMASARYLNGVGANDSLWSNNQGMGEMNLGTFFDFFVTPTLKIDQSAANTFTATGQTRTFLGSITSSSKPLRITTSWTDAPGSTTGNAYVNNLDLEVTVGGVTYRGNVFSGANSVAGGSADFRNNSESVFLPAGVSGPITITIRATNIAGDGVPNFGGALDQDFALIAYNVDQGLAITSTVPALNSTVAVAPTSFTVNVTSPVNAGTLSASDFTVNGIAATSVSYVPGETSMTFTFAFSPVTTQGLQTMHANAGAFTRASDGGNLIVFDGSFRYDVVPLTVAGTTPTSPNGVLPLSGGATLRLTFNEPITPASVATSDFVLSAGAIGQMTFGSGNTTLDLTFTGLSAEGPYTVQLTNGSINDAYGNPLTAAFTGTYQLDFTSQPFAGPFGAVATSGLQIYQGSAVGTVNALAAGADVDEFTLSLDAGQSLAVKLVPAAGLRPRLTILDPSGATVADVSAGAAGATAVVPATAIPAGGVYVIRVQGVAGTTGSYTVQATLNAALESEGTPTFTGYSATAVAYAFEDIASSPTATRVLTSVDDTFVPISLPFSFTFQGAAYATAYVSSNGLITFDSGSSEFTNTDLTSIPEMPTIACMWDDLVTTASGVLWEVLGSAGSRRLIVQWENARYYAGTTTTLRFQAVLYEGTNEIRLNYANLSTGTAGSNEGASATVGIKGNGSAGRLLLAKDNGPNTYVGSSKSTLISPTFAAGANPNNSLAAAQSLTSATTTTTTTTSVTARTAALGIADPGGAADWYSLTVEAGVAMSLTVSNVTAGTLHVALYDSNGTTLLATGATNLTEAIQRFRAPATATYYAVVTGTANSQYALAAFLGAAFDAEGNDTPATAQSLVGARGAYGFARAAGTTTSDFESGGMDWVVNNVIRGTGASAGLWNVSTRRGTEAGHSQTQSFYYGNSSGNYDTGAAHAGTITSAPFVVGPSAQLAFNYVLLTETDTAYDQAAVQISINAGATWTTLLSRSTTLINSSVWRAATASLSAYAGQTAQIRFAFDTLDSVNNGAEGWYVDDVSISSAANDDWYSLTLPTGADSLRVETRTPGDGAGEFPNSFNPVLQVYDAAGTVLLGSGVPLADGRNEIVVLTGLTANSSYRVRVGGGVANTSGEYLLSTTIGGITPVALGSQNFNSLATSGTASTMPAGWAFVETGASANTTYTADTGSSTIGDSYDFGVAGVGPNTDRAFGSLRSDTLNTTFGASFTNSTGSAIGALSIAYVGEQWRLGDVGRPDRLDFQYSLNATSLTTGTWTDFDGLDFVAPVTAGTIGELDGNAAANRTALSGVVSQISIANGATIWVRWTDFDAAGDDDGLAIDDFTISAVVADKAPTAINLSQNSVAEHQAVGAVVGAFSAVDPDVGDVSTFTLVSGAGDDDNASFTIVDGQLRTAAIFDFPTKNSYSIRVKATDSSGRTFEQPFTVTLTDLIEHLVSLDGSNNLVVDDVTGLDDNLSVVVSGANLVIANTAAAFAPPSIPGAVLSNANSTLTIPLASIPGTKIILDVGGGADTVTVNHAGGAFGKTIDVNGGDPTTSPGDALVIAGGNQGTVTYDSLNLHDGAVALSNFGTINYTSLESLSNTGSAADVVFNLPASTSTHAFLGDDDAVGNGLSRLSGATFAPTTFASPTGSLTINRAWEASDITVNALPDFNASLALSALESATSAVSFNGVSLASGQTLQVFAASIGVNAPLTTSGNATFSAVNGIVVAPTASIATGAASMTLSAATVDVQGTLTSSGVVTLTSQADRPIDLGTKSSGSLSLTDAELDRITAGTLVIGDAGSGAITVTSVVYLTDGPVIPNFHLRSGSTVTATAAPILAAGLAVNAGGAATISHPSTNVATIAVAAGGAISVRDANGLIVGAVDGVNGLSTTNGTVSVQVDLGDMTVADTPAANDVSATGDVFMALDGNEALLTVAAGAVIAGSGPHAYQMDKIDLLGTIDVGLGNVRFGPGSSTSKAVNLGSTVDSTANTLEMSDAELDRVVAGSLRIHVNSGITVSQPISPAVASELLLLSNGSVTQSAGAAVTVTRLGVSVGGSVSMPEANDVDQLNANASVGNVVFTDSDGFAVQDVGIVGGGVRAFAGAVLLTAITGNVTVTNTTAADDLDATAGISVSLLGNDALLTIASGASVRTTSGDAFVVADKMSLLGTVTATGQIVSVRPAGSDAIDLGATDDTAANTLQLSDAELDRVTAGAVRIGAAASGAISISSDIGLAETDVLHLRTGSSISSSGGAISETNLVLEAAAGVDLPGQIHSVSTLAGTTSGAPFVFGNGGSVAIGAVDGVSGIATAGGPVTVTAYGASALTVSQPIAAGNANVTLSANDIAIGAAISAGSQTVALLSPNSARPISLGAEVVGSLSLTDAELDFVTAGTLQIGDAIAGAITIAAPLTPASTAGLSLVTAATIDDANATGTDVAVGALALFAAGANGIGIAGDSAIEIDVTSLTANAPAGSVALAEANSATIGAAGLNALDVAFLIGGTFVSGGSNRIAAGVVLLEPSATLDLNGFSDTIDQLSLYGGPSSGAAVTTGSGSLGVTSVFIGGGAFGSTISGHLDFGGATRTITVSDGTAAVDLTLAAAIANGALTVQANGAFNPTIVLSGASSYSGPTTISSGTLLVSGSLSPNSVVSVAAGATLGGSGAVGPVTVADAAFLAPGTGVLDSGSASLSGDSTFNVQLDSPTAYSRLNVAGTVALGGAILSVSYGYLGAHTFTLIDNDGVDAVSGTFEGLPEAATYVVSGRTYRITYVGGDGNDVVLSALPNTYVWDGGGADSNFSTAANWVGDVAPQSGENLVFPSAGTPSTRFAPVNDFVGYAFATITIDDSDAGHDFDVSGNALTLNGGIALTGGKASLVFRPNVILGANASFTSPSASVSGDVYSFTCASLIDTNGFVLTVTGISSFNFNGAIGGSGGLKFTANNDTWLSAANTYTGVTEIVDGNAGLQASGTFGAASAGTIATNGTVRISTNVTSSEPITLQGTSAFVYGGAGAVFAGPITLNVSGTAAFVNSAASATFTVSGSIGGSAGDVEFRFGQSGSTITLSGANSYAASTSVVQAGILKLGASGTLPDGSAVKLKHASAVLNLNGFSETIGSLEGDGLGVFGQVQLGSGTLSVGAADTSTTFGGLISGAGKLTKVGAGTLTLTNTSNSYLGQTTIAAGVLSVPSLANAGSNSPIGAATGSNATIVIGSASAATLLYSGSSGSSNRTISIGGPGGGSIRRSASGTLALTGGIVNGGHLLTFDAALGVIVASGVISGAGGLTKTGAGTLTLNNAANSYTGPTTIARGTVNVATFANAGSNSSLGSATGVNATIVVNNNSGFGVTLAYSGETTSTNRSIANVGSGGLTVRLLADETTFTFTGAIDNGGNLLTFDAAAGAIAVSGAISGAGGLTKTGSGDLILSSATSAFAGGVAVNGGRLSATGDAALGATSGIATVAASGELVFTGNATTNRTFDIAGKLVNLGTTDLTFGGGSTATIRAGGIVDLGSNDAFVADAAVDNSGEFGSNTNSVVVDSLGRVKGSGVFHRVLTQNGGVFSPGNSPGPATMDTFPINGGGSFGFEISNATGAAGNVSGWDLASAAPTVFSPASAQIVLTATPASKYVVRIDSRLDDGLGQTAGAVANFNPALEYAWKFLDGSSAATTVTGTFDPAAFDVVTTGFQNAFGGTFSIALRDGGKNLYVVYTPPPPTVVSVAPFIGPTSGGNHVVITGTNFGAITAVNFGAASAVSYTVLSETQITAVAPESASAAPEGASMVDVSVASFGVTSNTTSTGDDYTYAVPAVTSVEVNGGDVVARNKSNVAPEISAQSSVVSQLLVTFNQKVKLDVGAFTISPIAVTSQGAPASTSDVAVLAKGVATTGDEDTGYVRYVLTFAPGAGVNVVDNATGYSGSVFTTLKDGVYQLNTIGSKVHAGLSDTAANRADTFWSFFGAANPGDVKITSSVGGGDDELRVDGLALSDVYATFGSSFNAPNPPYNVAFDSDLDGDVDGIDLGRLYLNFGTIWNF